MRGVLRNMGGDLGAHEEGCWYMGDSWGLGGGPLEPLRSRGGPWHSEGGLWGCPPPLLTPFSPLRRR